MRSEALFRWGTGALGLLPFVLAACGRPPTLRATPERGASAEPVPGRATLAVVSQPADIGEEITPGAPETSPPEACGQLDTLLVEFLAASDRLEFARQHGLDLNASGIGVTIFLQDPSVDISPFQVAVRNVRGPVVEGYLPVEQLCPLANAPGVLRVTGLMRVKLP